MVRLLAIVALFVGAWFVLSWLGVALVFLGLVLLVGQRFSRMALMNGAEFRLEEVKLQGVTREHSTWLITMGVKLHTRDTALPRWRPDRLSWRALGWLPDGTARPGRVEVVEREIDEGGGWELLLAGRSCLGNVKVRAKVTLGVESTWLGVSYFGREVGDDLHLTPTPEDRAAYLAAAQAQQPDEASKEALRASVEQENPVKAAEQYLASRLAEGRAAEAETQETPRADGFTVGREVSALTFDDTGAVILVGTMRGAFSAWQGPEWKRTMNLQFMPESAIGRLVYDATLRRAFASRATIVKLLQFGEGFPAQEGQVTSLSFPEKHTKQVVPCVQRGDRVWSGGYDGRVVAWNDAGGVLAEATMKGGVMTLALSPDGQVLVAAGESGELVAFEATTLRLQWKRKVHTKDVYDLAWTADGQSIVTACAGDGSVATVAPDGSDHRQVKLGVPCFALAISSDGDRIAIGAGTSVLVLNARQWTPEQELKGHTGIVQAVAFSPNLRQIASGSFDGTVRLWDLAPLS